MQGIFIGNGRPKSKKAIKEQAAIDSSRIYLEATSMFGNEYAGPASGMPEGKKISFVGPDPYSKRDFYGTITRKGDKVVVS